MTVAELGRRMSSRELSEWIAYDQINAEERRHREMESKARSGAEQRIRQRPRRR